MTPPLQIWYRVASKNLGYRDRTKLYHKIQEGGGLHAIINALEPIHWKPLKGSVELLQKMNLIDYECAQQQQTWDQVLEIVPGRAPLHRGARKFANRRSISIGIVRSRIKA